MRAWARRRTRQRLAQTHKSRHSFGHMTLFSNFTYDTLFKLCLDISLEILHVRSRVVVITRYFC